MPLVSIDLNANTHGRRANEIAQGVHDALVQTIGIPTGDRFQILTRRDASDIVIDPEYLAARQDIVYVRITLVEGRSEDQKRNLYRQINDNLSLCGVRREDVFVVLTENSRSDWSVGLGEAQLLEATIRPEPSNL